MTVETKQQNAGTATGQDGGQEPTNTDPKDSGGQEPQGGKQSTDPKNQDPSPGGDDLGFSDKQKAYVDGLRSESAKYRTKAKDLESQVGNLNKRFDDLQGGLKKLFGDESSDLTPEQQVQQLTSRNEELELQSAISEAAISLGVTGDDFEYFSFLLQREAGALEEGQELSEEVIQEVAQKAKGRSGTANSTSVDGAGNNGQGGDNPPPSNGAGEVSLDDFCDMTLSEKSELYQKNKALYDSLHKQAVKEGRLV